MKKKIICLDLDGVIYPNLIWLGSDTLRGKPVDGAKEAIDELKEDYTIIINSARFNDIKTIPRVKEWLDDNYIYYDKISEKKPHADIYIDDKAIGFSGNWDNTLSDVYRFKQWQTDKKEIAYNNLRKWRR
tara:strand:- start:97 stop:486 length:390 start_codon:yes stop_codon:yes gene_type:complete